MGVTVYLLDSSRQVRRVLVDGVSELTHQEDKWTLSAVIPSDTAAQPGEYLGFCCADGRFRLFEIDDAEVDTGSGTLEITATDAAVSDLGAIVVESVTLPPLPETEGGTAATAAPEQPPVAMADALAAVLQGTGWTLGSVCAADTASEYTAYYQTAWDALKRISAVYGVRISPWYSFSGGAVTGRVLDIVAKERVFRGRIFDAARDAGNASIVRSGSPRTRVYAVGKVTGTATNGSGRLTVADAVWSAAGGDPTDKPAGQTYVEDAAAVAQYGVRSFVYQDQYEADAGKLLRKAWEELQKRKMPTVSGTATAYDLEMAPGYSFKQVRLYDRVAITLRDGTCAEAQVIAIKRDYVRPTRTKITFGEEAQSLAHAVAKVASNVMEVSRRVGGCSNSAKEDKVLIIDNYERIVLKADKSTVDGLTTRVNSAYIDIDANRAAIELKASSTEVTKLSDSMDDLVTRVSEAEIDIDAANAKINLKASREEITELTQRVSQAEIDIDGAKANIALKASQSSVDALGERVTSAEISIDGTRGEIALKVNKDGVISSINQTAEEVKIQAGKINLSGYVTASQLQASLATIRNEWADMIMTGSITATGGTFTNLRANTEFKFKNSDISKESLTVLTGASISVSRGGNGYVTDVTLTKTTHTLKYLGY